MGQRSAKAKGTLGCLDHDEPFHCAELHLRTPGASRRFLLYCPVRGCKNGFRLTASDFMQVSIDGIVNVNDHGDEEESDDRSKN